MPPRYSSRPLQPLVPDTWPAAIGKVFGEVEFIDPRTGLVSGPDSVKLVGFFDRSRTRTVKLVDFSLRGINPIVLNARNRKAPWWPASIADEGSRAHRLLKRNIGTLKNSFGVRVSEDCESPYALVRIASRPRETLPEYGDDPTLPTYPGH
jgi:hypothetical protein